MNKTIHFTRSMLTADKLAKRLRKDTNRNVAVMDWADAEVIDEFNRGKYTDMVTKYVVAATGFRVKADVIVHHDLPIEARDNPFVLQANNRAPNAAIVYRYPDHFEYDRV